MGFSFWCACIIALLVVGFRAINSSSGSRRITRYEESIYAKATGHSYRDVMADKGLYGEYRLGCAIQEFEPNAHPLFNVYIPRADGTTSEIDALLVTVWGIVVFENKNYSGAIYGREGDRTWTQFLNRNSKFTFPNPVRQNRGHIAALAAYLGVSEDALVPVIVFADKARIDKADGGAMPVIHTSQVGQWLMCLKGRPAFLGPDEYARIRLLLEPCVRVSEEVKRAHIQAIQDRGFSKRAS